LEERVQEILSSFQGQRSELIPMLQAVQNEFGFLSEQQIKSIAKYLGVPESQVFGVATFFAQFYFTPRGKHEIKVCIGTACHVKGANRILDAFERELGVCCGETTANAQFSLEKVACVGSCAIAPVVMIADNVYGRLETKKVKGVLEKYEPEV
jgi:NADH-quinone oxidoreductase subunit E